jgi:hypothetical protein
MCMYAYIHICAYVYVLIIMHWHLCMYVRVHVAMYLSLLFCMPAEKERVYNYERVSMYFDGCTCVCMKHTCMYEACVHV